MPGKVLRKHKLLVKESGGYALADDFRSLSADEADQVVGFCVERIAAYKAKRGEAIWHHRAIGFGAMPGRLRYQTLKRAGFRCELCGISAEVRALDVDHIVPRKLGGLDVLENLQALCWLCNTNKGAGDDADLRNVSARYADRQAECPFCELPRERIIAESSLGIAFRDKFQVTNLHTLVIPKRHVADYFSLFASELKALQHLLEQARNDIVGRDSDVSGFNVGVNAGQSAGQTVFHCHMHLIPRRVGDTPDPTGGVRCVIAGRTNPRATHE